MNIEEFYDADPRRRASPELQFGLDWHDSHGRRYELNWVADTGELYIMQDEPPPAWTDPFGDFYVFGADPRDLGVRVLTVVEGADTVRAMLDGWAEAMGLGDSVAWLVERLADAAGRAVAHLDPLDRDECLRLLGTAVVGRIGLVVDGRPVILPVNFALDGDKVVFRTAEGTVLTQTSMAPVAFEVDHVDEAGRVGWSVLVRGVARDIGDALDPTSERLRNLSLVSWAPGTRARWFHVVAEEVTGRRLRLGPAPTPDP